MTSPFGSGATTARCPGPELRVREGDTVRITLKNELPVPTTIHWHGINVPNAMDGVAGLNQAPVDPGEDFVYEFTATPAGTRWYHSHTDPAVQVPMGLYGALIVEPSAQPAKTYDREYTLMLAEWDLELTPAVAAGTEPTRSRRCDAARRASWARISSCVNGKMHGAFRPFGCDRGRARSDPLDPHRRDSPPDPHPRSLVQDRGHRWQPGSRSRPVDQGHGADRTGRALRPRTAWRTTPGSGWCTATSSTTWPTA